MSKQLALSAAFSVVMMASYVLFGVDAAREPLAHAPGIASPIQISAPAVPGLPSLLPALR